MKGFVLFTLMVVYIIAIFGMYNAGMSDAYEEMKQYPSAMDVYAGKTTLQYTIVDGVKKDSVVVFK